MDNTNTAPKHDVLVLEHEIYLRDKMKDIKRLIFAYWLMGESTNEISEELNIKRKVVIKCIRNLPSQLVREKEILEECSLYGIPYEKNYGE